MQDNDLTRRRHRSCIYIDFKLTRKYRSPQRIRLSIAQLSQQLYVTRGIQSWMYLLLRSISQCLLSQPHLACESVQEAFGQTPWKKKIKHPLDWSSMILKSQRSQLLPSNCFTASKKIKGLCVWTDLFYQATMWLVSWLSVMRESQLLRSVSHGFKVQHAVWI